MFGSDWESAEAKIVARRLHSESHGGGYDQPSYDDENFEYVVDVRPKSGAASFRATIKDPFNQISFRQPDVGMVVQVKFRHKDQKVKFDRSDPALHQDDLATQDKKRVAAAHSGEAQARWDAIAGAAPGSAATERDARNPGVDRRLRKLVSKLGGRIRQYRIAHPDATRQEVLQAGSEPPSAPASDASGVGKLGPARAQDATGLEGEGESCACWSGSPSSTPVVSSQMPSSPPRRQNCCRPSGMGRTQARGPRSP